MSANLQPKTLTLDTWLDESAATLAGAGITSARLDAELILSHTLRRPRTHIHAHGDETLSPRLEEILAARLQLRLDHTPIAYIVGHKDFYGRRFKTTPAALIPRPESEAMIEVLADIVPKNLSLIPHRLHIVDVGTGTGCLGITAKLEWPELDVTLTDSSNHALNLAKENAAALGADVSFIRGDLLRGYATPVDIIVANLPYVDRRWDVSLDTQAEPQEALYADDEGLALIRQLIDQAALLLRPRGSLLIESDVRQQTAITALARQQKFKYQQTNGLITHFSRD